MVCLAATRLDADRVATAAALIADGIDWEALVSLAETHAVTALVCHNLASTSIAGVPDDIRDAARVYGERNGRENQRLTDALLAIIDALARHDIAAVPFKGPYLADAIYGDLALRRFRDLDFLVPEDRISDTLAVLRTLDYRISSPRTPRQERAFRAYAGQYIFFKDGGPDSKQIAIEPHWAFCPRTLAVPLDYEALWRRARPAPFAGRQVLNWPAEDLLLILCLHGSKEQWTRLQWICDVAELLRARPDLDWDVIVDRARNQGCLRMLYLGLLLAKRMLDAPVPARIAERAAADAMALRLASELRRRFFAGPPVEHQIYRLSSFRLRMRERMRDKAGYIFRTITTPRVQHFGICALPDALFFAYVPIKLVHDYVLLPPWLLGKAIARVISQARP